MLDLAAPDALVADDPDEGPRRSVAVRSAVVTVVLVIALVAAGGFAYGQLPKAQQLSPEPVAAEVSDSMRNAQAAIATDRLAVAAGRNLAQLAEVSPGSVDGHSAGAATVGGAQASSGKYAETLAELTKAEEAAAAQLALTEQEVAAAQRQRERAAAKRAEEEATAARAVDDAVAAAIAAARAQSSAAVLPGEALVGTGGGSASSAATTNTAQVHELVTKHFPNEQVGNAMAIARCESGHANRISGVNSNGTRDYGVFQINDGGTLQAALRRLGIAYTDIDDARQKALDPALNVQMARVIWESRGWQPWTCAAKMQVVAGLYERKPGPMSGKYDEYGRA